MSTQVHVSVGAIDTGQGFMVFFGFYFKKMSLSVCA